MAILGAAVITAVPPPPPRGICCRWRGTAPSVFPHPGPPSTLFWMLHHCPSTVWFLLFPMGPQGSWLNWDPDTDSSPGPTSHGRATWGKSILLPEPQFSHLYNGGLVLDPKFSNRLHLSVGHRLKCHDWHLFTLLSLPGDVFPRAHLCFLGTSACFSEPTSTLHTAAGGNGPNGSPAAHTFRSVPLHHVCQPRACGSVRTRVRQA